eukprot:RCo009967
MSAQPWFSHVGLGVDGNRATGWPSSLFGPQLRAGHAQTKELFMGFSLEPNRKHPSRLFPSTLRSASAHSPSQPKPRSGRKRTLKAVEAETDAEATTSRPVTVSTRQLSSRGSTA